MRVTGKEYSKRRRGRKVEESSSSTQENAKDADFDDECYREKEAEIASSIGTSQSDNEDPGPIVEELSPQKQSPKRRCQS